MNQLDNRIANPIPSAPPLDAPAPDGSFVKDALLLALRESQRGEPGNAAKELKIAQQQLANVPEGMQRTYWQEQINAVAAYVDANGSPQRAKDLRTAAGQGDAIYVRNQKLTPAELLAQNNDNADTAEALDAERRGENPTLVYASSTTRRAVAQASSAAAGIVGAALSPWKLGIALALGVGAVLLGAWLYFDYKAVETAGKVGS